MTAVFTPTGGGEITLGDDGNRIPIKMEPPLGLQDAEQKDELAFAAAPFIQGRGNTQGACVFTVEKSHADEDTALAYAKTQQGYRSQWGVLVLTMRSGGTMTMTAYLHSAIVVMMRGVRWGIRYTFTITTMT